MQTPLPLDNPSVYHINVQQSTPFSINCFTICVQSHSGEMIFIYRY